MKPKYTLAFMDMCERFGQTSEATRLKVGALIVKDGSVISEGVNGSYAGLPNVCEGEDGQTLPCVRHAEAAALDKLVRKTESSVGAELFVSHAPCIFCAYRIVDAGIRKVYYRHSYRLRDGIEYLISRGVEIEQL